jgi:hypothetical protein
MSPGFEEFALMSSLSNITFAFRNSPPVAMTLICRHTFSPSSLINSSFTSLGNWVVQLPCDVTGVRVFYSSSQDV